MKAMLVLIAAVVMFANSTSAEISRSPTVVKEFKLNEPAPRPASQWHVDHVIPLACGGPDHAGNLQYLRTADNLRKGAVGCKTGMPIHNAIRLMTNSHRLASANYIWESAIFGGQLVIVGYGFYAGSSSLLENTNYGQKIVDVQTSQTVEPIVEYSKRIVPANKSALEYHQRRLANALCYFSSKCM